MTRCHAGAILGGGRAGAGAARAVAAPPRTRADAERMPRRRDDRRHPAVDDARERRLRAWQALRAQARSTWPRQTREEPPEHRQREACSSPLALETRPRRQSETGSAPAPPAARRPARLRCETACEARRRRVAAPICVRASTPATSVRRWRGICVCDTGASAGARRATLVEVLLEHLCDARAVAILHAEADVPLEHQPRAPPRYPRGRSSRAGSRGGGAGRGAPRTASTRSVWRSDAAASVRSSASVRHAPASSTSRHASPT